MLDDEYSFFFKKRMHTTHKMRGARLEAACITLTQHHLLRQAYKPSRIVKAGDFMAEGSKVKITVLKKTNTKEIFGDDPPLGQAEEACRVFAVGQEFIVGEDGGMPEGFCHWAWNDIYKVVTALELGGNFPWMKEKGTSVSCCTDGFRPVIFEIRRIE